MTRELLKALWPYPEGRRCAYPATEQVLRLLNHAERYTLSCGRRTVHAFESDLTPLQQHVLDLFRTRTCRCLHRGPATTSRRAFRKATFARHPHVVRLACRRSGSSREPSERCPWPEVQRKEGKGTDPQSRGSENLARLDPTLLPCRSARPSAHCPDGVWLRENRSRAQDAR